MKKKQKTDELILNIATVFVLLLILSLLTFYISKIISMVG